jgi:hypothetical protein
MTGPITLKLSRKGGLKQILGTPRVSQTTMTTPMRLMLNQSRYINNNSHMPASNGDPPLQKKILEAPLHTGTFLRDFCFLPKRSMSAYQTQPQLRMCNDLQRRHPSITIKRSES